jgi:hypothetical protein
VFSNAACLIEGNARSTGPKATAFDVSDPSVVDPDFRLSLDNGKDISRASALFAKALALLNSSIVQAVFASGSIKAVHPVDTNGILIVVSAAAGCIVISMIKIMIIAFATSALTL